MQLSHFGMIGLEGHRGKTDFCSQRAHWSSILEQKRREEQEGGSGGRGARPFAGTASSLASPSMLDSVPKDQESNTSEGEGSEESEDSAFDWDLFINDEGGQVCGHQCYIRPRYYT